MPSSAVQTCARSEEHTSELQSHDNLVCRLLLEKNHTTPPAPAPPTSQPTTGQTPQPPPPQQSSEHRGLCRRQTAVAEVKSVARVFVSLVEHAAGLPLDDLPGREEHR